MNIKSKRIISACIIVLFLVIVAGCDLLSNVDDDCDVDDDCQATCTGDDVQLWKCDVLRSKCVEDDVLKCGYEEVCNPSNTQCEPVEAKASPAEKCTPPKCATICVSGVLYRSQLVDGKCLSGYSKTKETCKAGDDMIIPEEARASQSCKQICEDNVIYNQDCVNGKCTKRNTEVQDCKNYGKYTKCEQHESGKFRCGVPSDCVFDADCGNPVCEGALKKTPKCVPDYTNNQVVKYVCREERGNC